jgi:hypothetical protein
VRRPLRVSAKSIELELVDLVGRVLATALGVRLQRCPCRGIEPSLHLLCGTVGK